MELARNTDPSGDPFGSWFHSAIAGIGEKTTAILITVESLSTQNRELREDVKDHELRIRALERRIWLAVGASGGIAGGIAGFLTKYLGG